MPPVTSDTVTLFDYQGNPYTVVTHYMTVGGVLNIQGHVEGNFLVDPVSGYPFVIDADGAMLVNQNGADTATITQTTMSTSNQVILAANTARVAATVANASASNEIFVALGTAATLTEYTVPILPGRYWEVPGGYRGTVQAIAGTGGDKVNVTEITP